MLNAIFCDEPIKDRRPEIDLLKFLCIVGMVFCHLCYAFENHILKITPFQDFWYTVGGDIVGAQAFMIAMGISINYSRHNSPKDMAMRGWKLILFGYLLNVARTTFPQLILGYRAYGETEAPLLLGILEGDILQFAGLAFVFMAILKKGKVSNLSILLIALVMNGVEGLVYGSSIDVTQATLVDYVTGLLIFRGFVADFPLCGWFIYVAVGYLFGQLLQHVKEKDAFYKRVLLIALAFSFFSVLGMVAYNVDILEIFDDDILFYCMPPFNVMFFVSFAFVWISLLYFVAKPLSKTAFWPTVRFFSTNINQLYITHWVLLGWLTFAFEYFGLDGNLNDLVYALLGIGIILASCGIVNIWNKIKAGKQA